MRILVVHEVEFVSKVVYEWQEFPEILSRAGHEVSVLDYDTRSGWRDILRWGAGPKRITTPWRLDPSRSFELLRMIGPPIPGFRRIWAACASFVVLRRVLRERRPDVVLLYAAPTCGIATLRAARREQIPVVFRSIDILAQLVPRAIRSGVHVLERIIYPRCDRALTATPQLSRYVERMSSGRTRTALLRSPVDAEFFAPQSDCVAQTRRSLGIPEDACVAVFVGVLFSFTGLARVVESWEHVLRTEPKARLLVVGGGPEEQRLRSFARRLPYESSITFTGMRPYDDIPALISAGDIGLCPFDVLPVTADVNPIKVLQYASCETPCLCTPLRGTMELMPAIESGVVYASAGDGFTDALIDLMTSPAKRAELGAAGRRWVLANHSFAAVTDQLVQELTDAVDRASLSSTG